MVRGEERVKFSPRLTLKQHLLRRFVHLSSSLILIYFLLPDTVFYIPKKALVIILFVFVPLTLELTRIRSKKLIFGQRPHEIHMIGSYAWSLMASTVIILVLPQEIAAPVIVIYAFADPLIGEIRLWKKRMVLPLGTLLIAVSFMVFGYDWWLALIAGLFMVIGEAVELVGDLRIRPELVHMYTKRMGIDRLKLFFKTDDDFTTQIIPAMVLGVIYIYLPAVFPDPVFSPLPFL